MINKLNAAFHRPHRQPVAASARQIGGLIGAVLLCGQFVACSSEVPEVRATEAVAASIPTQTAAETCFTFERFGQVVMYPCNITHESDLPGASIAEYEKSSYHELTSPETIDKSAPVPKPQ